MKCKNYTLQSQANKVVHSLELILLLLLFMVSVASAQTNFGSKAPFKVIPFGQKIDFGTLESSVRWTITNKSGETMPANLRGNEINNYVFEKAGTYEVRFSETKNHTDECNHPAYPENFTIEVSPFKMVFDFSKINFSREITSGSSCEGIEVTVPATIEVQKGVSKKVNLQPIVGSGIGVQIVGNPVQSNILLSNGTLNLRYKLSGIASSPEYIMLDFYDVNNQIQTYYLPERLK